MLSLKHVKAHGLWWDAVPSCPPLVMQQQAAGTEPLCTGTGTCHAHATAIESRWLILKQRWIWQASPVGYQRDNSRGRVGDVARKLKSMRSKVPCFSTKSHLPSPTHPSLPYLPIQLLEAKLPIKAQHPGCRPASPREHKYRKYTNRTLLPHFLQGPQQQRVCCKGLTVFQTQIPPNH